MKVAWSVAILFLIVGCASDPVVEQASDPAPPPAPTPAAPPEPAPPAPEVKPEEPPQEPAEPFEVTEELYTRTFDEIDAVIARLNTAIQKMDYETWQSFLTERYIVETSKTTYLEKWKDDPSLKRRNIVLKDLGDFFQHLVVPRRANVKLDEIEFVDDSRVYAFTVIQGQKYLLYYLIRLDDGWKVDFY